MLLCSLKAVSVFIALTGEMEEIYWDKGFISQNLTHNWLDGMRMMELESLSSKDVYKLNCLIANCFCFWCYVWYTDMIADRAAAVCYSLISWSMIMLFDLSHLEEAVSVQIFEGRWWLLICSYLCSAIMQMPWTRLSLNF